MAKEKAKATPPRLVFDFGVVFEWIAGVWWVDWMVELVGW